MLEQSPAKNKTNSISDANRDIYMQYKEGVDLAEKRKEWLEDKTFQGVIKRATNTAVKTLLVQSPNMATYDDLNAPYDAARDAKRHLRENEEAVKLDAIYDATAGVELNLPENGLPETVTNVKVIPEQQPRQE